MEKKIIKRSLGFNTIYGGTYKLGDDDANEVMEWFADMSKQGVTHFSANSDDCGMEIEVFKETIETDEEFALRKEQESRRASYLERADKERYELIKKKYGW